MIKKYLVSYFSLLDIKESYFSYIAKNKDEISDITMDMRNSMFIDTRELYTANFPIILDNKGEVCELSTLYIADYLKKNEDLTGKTIDLIAKDIQSYYEFIHIKNLSLFHFPNNKFERVTTQYRKYLMDQVISGNGEVSTVKRKINRIVNFYEFIKKQLQLENAKLENPPYRIKSGKHKYEIEGNFYEKEYRSTDLAVKLSRNSREIDSIFDGGKLRPLLFCEQEIISEYINQYAPRTIQLICSIAFHSGARLQTICTIRKKHIYEMIERKKTASQTYILSVGLGTSIDSKRGKKYVLEIPSWLVDELKKYVESEEWKARALKSFYKNKYENYIFLTKSGQPFYTSKKEVLDRLELVDNYTQKEKMKIYTGEAVRVILNTIYKKITIEHKDFRKFRFHDFRATFGMNLLKLLINKDMEISQILHIIKNRMGHSSLVVTERYLDFKVVLEKYMDVQDELEDKLMR